MRVILFPLLGTLLASSYAQSYYGMGGYGSSYGMGGYGSSIGSWSSASSSKKGEQLVPVQTKKSQPAPPPPPPPQPSKKSEYVPPPQPRKKTEYVAPVNTKKSQPVARRVVQYVAPVDSKKSSGAAASYSSFRGSSMASPTWGYGNLNEIFEQHETEDDTYELDAEDENTQYIRAGGSLVETEDGRKLKVVDGKIQLEPELEDDEAEDYKSLLQTEDEKRSVVNDEGIPLLFDAEDGAIRPHDPERDDPLPLRLMPGLVKSKNGDPVIAHDKKNKKKYHLVVDAKKEKIQLVKKDGKKVDKVKGKLPLTTADGEAVTSPHTNAPLFFHNGKIIEGESQEDEARSRRGGRREESDSGRNHRHAEDDDRPRRGSRGRSH